MKKIILLINLFVITCLFVQNCYAQMPCNSSFTYYASIGNTQLGTISNGSLTLDVSVLQGTQPLVIGFWQPPCGNSGGSGFYTAYSAGQFRQSPLISSAAGGYLSFQMSEFSTTNISPLANVITFEANCNSNVPPYNKCILPALTVRFVEIINVGLNTECVTDIAGNPTGNVKYKVQLISGTVQSSNKIKMVYNGVTTYHPLVDGTYIDVTNVTANNVLTEKPDFTLVSSNIGYALANSKINGQSFNGNNGFHFRGDILNNTCVPASSVAVALTPECCKDASGNPNGKVRFKMIGNANTGSKLNFLVNGVTTTTAFINNTYTECYNGVVAITLLNLTNQKIGTINGQGYNSSLNCNYKYSQPVGGLCPMRATDRTIKVGAIKIN